MEQSGGKTPNRMVFTEEDGPENINTQLKTNR